jgi:hypothetical protein
MKQLLQVLAAEQRALHQQKEREVQENGARRQLRRLAAARPERDQKLSELHQKAQAPVKRQLGHAIARNKERTKPPLLRRNPKDKNSILLSRVH